MGLILTGIYIGNSERRGKDGTMLGYSYLVSVGTDAYKVACDDAPPAGLAFGDEVSFRIRCRAYNGTIYYNGELIRE